MRQNEMREWCKRLTLSVDVVKGENENFAVGSITCVSGKLYFVRGHRIHQRQSNDMHVQCTLWWWWWRLPGCLCRIAESRRGRKTMMILINEMHIIGAVMLWLRKRRIKIVSELYYSMDMDMDMDIEVSQLPRVHGQHACCVHLQFYITRFTRWNRKMRHGEEEEAERKLLSDWRKKACEIPNATVWYHVRCRDVQSEWLGGGWEGRLTVYRFLFMLSHFEANASAINKTHRSDHLVAGNIIKFNI